ncbi:MAG: hypothetical protein DRJ64_10675 [Thermoprotei archaeon]|nr:MAG: hypothetical protein DRJ64_10675 [Thermoprotei archaeon]
MKNTTGKRLTKEQAMECAKQKVYGDTYVNIVASVFEDDYTPEEFRIAVKAIKKSERHQSEMKLAREARAEYEAYEEEV